IGYAHPMWLTLADYFGLGLSVLTREDDLAAQNLELRFELEGEMLSSKRQEEINDEMGNAFKSMIRDARKITNPYQPWRAQHAQHLDDRPLSDWIASLPCSRLAKAAIEAQFANDNGAPTSHQSYLANLALVAGARSPDAEDGYFKLTEN